MKRILAIIALALCVAAPALAAPLPDTLRSAGVTQAEWDAVQAEVARTAQRLAVSQRTLAAAAERLGLTLARAGRRVSAGEILAAIDGQAERIRDLEQRLSRLERDEAPEIAALVSRARAAIAEGDLDAADAVLEQAQAQRAERNARLSVQLEQGLLEEASIIASRGEVAMLRANYLAAAGLFAEAAAKAPEGAPERWRYRSENANALMRRGEIFGEPGPLRDAARVYREQVLPLVPQDRAAGDWADAQNNLGATLSALGALGEQAAARDAIAAFRAALEVYTRESSPTKWALVQSNLAGALMVLGALGDERAARDAVAALRAALEVRTRAASAADWAVAQNNLGIALGLLGAAGDRQARRDSIAAFRAALEVHAHAAPELRTSTQNGLAMALLSRAEAERDLSLVHEAIDLLRANLSLYTRGREMSWAQTQTTLGVALSMLGARGDGAAQRDAVAAFRAALEVYTLAETPYPWASTQFGLALTLSESARRGDRSHLQAALSAARSALSGFEQVGDAFNVDQARRLIANLEAL